MFVPCCRDPFPWQAAPLPPLTPLLPLLRTIFSASSPPLFPPTCLPLSRTHASSSPIHARARAQTLSALRAAGRRVCLRAVALGLSDGLNLFATAATAAADPATSPPARRADVRRLRRLVLARLLPPPTAAAAAAAANGRRPPEVGFVERSGPGTTRRGLHNAAELRAAVRAAGAQPVGLTFEGLTMAQQVAAVQVRLEVGRDGRG